MKKSILPILAFFLFFSCSLAWAADWILLHEQADSISLEEALKSKKDNPLSFESLYVLALVYLNEYRAQDAKDIFLQILEIDPKSIEAKWGVAECLRRQHRYEQSVQILQEIIEQHPSFSPAYITLGYIHYIQFDFDASIRMTGRVINQGQKNVDATNFLRAHGLYGAAKGMIAHYGGPLSKAINGAAVLKHLNIIQRLAPDSPVVNFGLGSYYMLIPVMFGQDIEKAKGYLEKTIADDPLFPDPYVRVAQIYKKRGDRAQYELYLEKALALDPQNVLALDIKTGTCRFICLTD